MALLTPVKTLLGTKTYVTQQTNLENTEEKGNKSRVWMSRGQKWASKLAKRKSSGESSLSSKASSIVLEERSLAQPRTDLPLTPPSTPINLFPSAIFTPPIPDNSEERIFGPGRRQSSSASVLCDLCFEFLEFDERPTAILEVRPKASLGTADQLEVQIIFTNPAFENLKPELNLDLSSPTGMGGLLEPGDGKVEWVIPNSNWKLRCISINGSYYTGVNGIQVVGRGHRWAKFMTVGPIANNKPSKYLGTQRAAEGTTSPDIYTEGYGGGREADVRKISIVEETSEEMLESVLTAVAKNSGSGTLDTPKTITPSQSRDTTSARRSLVSSNSDSRRPSQSPQNSRRDSSTVEILEDVSDTSRSTTSKLLLGESFRNRPNMDWTRGAMLRKNTQNLAGMDEHLNFLINAPWHESPIGPPLTWPISLRCIANVVMSFPHPAMVYWSRELITIYNPQAKIMAGENHPEALGKPFAVGFPAFKDYMMPSLKRALEGKTTLKTNEPLFLDIEVPNEECYYNFIISPIIGASGTAEGVLKQAHSRTSQVIQARRMQTLHKIREHVELIRDLERDEFWKLLLEGLGANEVDSPFALLYKVVSANRCVLAATLGIPDKILLEGDLVPSQVRVGGNIGSLTRRTGSPAESGRIQVWSGIDENGGMTPIDEDTPATTSSSSVFESDDRFLFFHEMLHARKSNSVVAKDLSNVTHEYKEKLAGIEYRGFGDPCKHAVVIPIQPSPSNTFGYLILGLNPRRPYNAEYLMWLNMLMEQLATSIGRVRLLTEDLRRAVQEARHQKQLASQALERKRQQENFIDISSHELRNPLSAVLQSAEGIIGLLNRHHADKNKPLDVEQITDSAQTILLCVNHQRLIIEDILAVSKLDSNLMTVTPVPSDPRDLIWNGLKMFEAELASKEISWDFQVLDSYDFLGVEWVKLDPSRTTQILVNLVANAIKFTALKSSKKKISVVLDASLESPTNWSNFDYLPTEKLKEDITEREDWGTGEPIFLSVAVKDTGIGISTENKRNLFQRFNQVPKTHITYGGSGLGLYISRRLCQLQGGNIGVSSVEGEGSTFRFYIKARRTAKPETPQTSIDSPGSTQGNRPALPSGPIVAPLDHITGRTNLNPLYYVLVVEDNLINQKVLRQQLIAEGCIVDTANNGQEALDKIMQSKFVKEDGALLDVVLMDMEMPIMGGVEATRRIRQLELERETLHVPIIGISANARPEQMAEMTEAGMDDAIPKPFRIPELLRKFRTLVQNPY